MSGHKSTVNALNSFTDSTGKAYGAPKFETVFEMARRLYNAKIGIVSTAFLADVSPRQSLPPSYLPHGPRPELCRDGDAH